MRQWKQKTFKEKANKTNENKNSDRNGVQSNARVYLVSRHASLLHSVQMGYFFNFLSFASSLHIVSTICIPISVCLCSPVFLRCLSQMCIRRLECTMLCLIVI